MSYWKSLAEDLEEDEVFRYSPHKSYNGIISASGYRSDSGGELVINHVDDMEMEFKVDSEALKELQAELYDYVIDRDVWSREIDFRLDEFTVRHPGDREDVRAVSVLEEWNVHITDLLYSFLAPD